MMSVEDITSLVRAKSVELGFAACGFAPAGKVDNQTASAFDSWIADGCSADMQYMSNYVDKRRDVTLLVEGAVSVISVAMGYFPATKLPEDTYQFAYYSYGKDYHDVMKARLLQLLSYIGTLCQDVHGCVFCDTAPVLERYWAWRAGLGWIGRNTSLVIPGAGSFFFLGEIVCDIPFVYDTPMRSRCGNCSKCLDACPTGALCKPYRIDARKCISYQTIENRGDIPQEIVSCLGNRVYGCDSCQKACPWNRFVEATHVAEFAASPELMAMTPERWQCLTVEEYRRLFKGSAVKRAKYEGLMRNIMALGNHKK